MIDWNRLDVLRAEVGGDAFGEVVALFLEETDGEVARLRGGSPGRGAAASLHFLRGAALNLGLAELARLCDEGERRLRTGGGFDLAALLASYDRARGALVAALPPVAG